MKRTVWPVADYAGCNKIGLQLRKPYSRFPMELRTQKITYFKKEENPLTKKKKECKGMLKRIVEGKNDEAWM